MKYLISGLRQSYRKKCDYINYRQNVDVAIKIAIYIGKAKIELHVSNTPL